MPEQLVSELIKPVLGTMDVSGMLRGEPGLPKRFVWPRMSMRSMKCWKGGKKPRRAEAVGAAFRAPA